MHVLTTAPFPHRCAELYESLHEARLWMSAGNTTSSIHFDTHENYMLQLDGSKDVYMYCSSPTAAFHADDLPHCMLIASLIAYCSSPTAAFHLSSLSVHTFAQLGAEMRLPLLPD
jgi:hypothetical protein